MKNQSRSYHVTDSWQNRNHTREKHASNPSWKEDTERRLRNSRRTPFSRLVLHSGFTRVRARARASTRAYTNEENDYEKTTTESLARIRSSRAHDRLRAAKRCFSQRSLTYHLVVPLFPPPRHCTEHDRGTTRALLVEDCR